MIIEVLMPALSPTMTEGTLAKWLKKEGDSVSPGEVIAEIETDKATMEVESVEEGFIGKIFVAEGTENVQVNSLIALILEEEADKEKLVDFKPKALAAESNPQQTKEPQQSSTSQESKANTSETNSGERVFASPLAKRIAQQNNLDLTSISGSGPRGRIIKSDVENAAARPQTQNANKAKMVSSGGYETKPLSNMRKVIAKRLQESKQNIPHFYLNVECNLDKLLDLRAEINANAEKDSRVSVNDLIIKATAGALRRVPEANSSWADDGIRYYNDVDISVAVAIEGGLITPIVKSADIKTLSEISSEMKDLAKRAREGKLMPEEYQGGSISISNLGMFGVEQFNAIINPPQSCILAIGAGIKKPAVVGDQIKISTMCNITLSCDHRVVDGAVGASLLSSLKDLIENPIKMLV
jgi:pyruvate dehydrogenase E2 component (dihydrolipoamide acetyltransferase)